jgi:hypothetical protein
VHDSRPIPGSFDEAIAGFREFLRAQGLPDQIRWVTQRSVLISSRGFYWIKFQNIADDLAIAHETYVKGINRGMGISINALCKTEANTFAYIFVPEDQEEAERLLIGGLKLSVPINIPKAKLIDNPFAWWALQRMYKMPIELSQTFKE